MNPTSDLDLSNLLSSFSRHKSLIASVVVVVSCLAAYLASVLPDIYQSSTLILVSPQRVPASFVTSTVTMNLGERMQSIVQEILSRTQLEKIVQEFNLYSSGSRSGVMDDRVEKLRRGVKIDIRRNNVFQLSYEAQDPEKAKQLLAEAGCCDMEGEPKRVI